MDRIVITDKHDEMERIGKELLELKSDIYNDKMISSIKAVIDNYAGDATATEKEAIFYRSIYDYWVYGNNVSEEFYFHFDKKTHEEKNTYVNFRNRYLYIYHLNKKEDSYLLNDKYKAYQMLKKYYKREIIQIESPDDFEMFSDFISRHAEFVAKPAALGLAIGVHKVNSAEYADKHELFTELLKEGSGFKKDYAWGKNSAIVIEEIIQQDSRLAEIHPQSVNGIRVTTVRVGNKVHIYYPWFKIGANGNFVTSAAQGTLDAGIDAETGIVNSLGFKENGIGFEYHPQTNIRIPGYQIPEWDSLVKMATEVAMSLDTLNYVGWDFVLTPNGWCIMEGNFAGEFMWQMVYGKGMKKEFEDLIGWKPSKEFWWQKDQA